MIAPVPVHCFSITFTIVNSGNIANTVIYTFSLVQVTAYCFENRNVLSLMSNLDILENNISYKKKNMILLPFFFRFKVFLCTGKMELKSDSRMGILNFLK